MMKKYSLLIIYLNKINLTFIKLTIFILYLSSTTLEAKNYIEFTTIEKSSYAKISEYVMRDAYSQLGVDMSIISLPAERAIVVANSGTVDGELYRIKNIHSTYNNLIMIPIPIGKMEGIAITKDKNLSPNTWESLNNHKVCFRNGVKFSEVGLSNITATAVNLNTQLFDMLEKDRCEIIVIARITSIPLTMKFIATTKKPLYQSVLQTYPLFHYLHKKNEHLVPELTEVLKGMQSEGLINKIRDQFIADMLNSNQ